MMRDMRQLASYRRSATEDEADFSADAASTAACCRALPSMPVAQ